MKQGFKLSFEWPNRRVYYCVIDMLFDSLVDGVYQSFSVFLDDVELGFEFMEV